MKTKDWASVVTPKVLLIGENSTLQWSDEVIDHVMFLDYFFRNKPYDLGERSRYAEAKSVFDMISEITGGYCRPVELYATNICMDILERAPKGKKLLIPEQKTVQAITHIKKILADNPTIKHVFAMGMQANYYLQKSGFYTTTDEFMHGAQARKVGLESDPQYYQPVDAKVFRKICGNAYDTTIQGVKLIPILPYKDFPLRDDNFRIYDESYRRIESFFVTDEK